MKLKEVFNKSVMESKKKFFKKSVMESTINCKKIKCLHVSKRDDSRYEGDLGDIKINQVKAYVERNNLAIH